MSQEELIHKVVDEISFGLISPKDLRKQSVVEIQTPDTYDEDGAPITAGLMDGRLGTLEPRQRCKTCGNTAIRCPGHFGHIELAVPIVHIEFTKIIFDLLKSTCRTCGRILLSEDASKKARQRIERFNELLGTIPDEVYKEISDTMKVGKVEKYGPEDLPAGPGLEGSKEIFVVEGRADVINLMRCGIFNTVALEGAKVPDSIKKITKERIATALLDGDRGGDLILKELIQVTNVKFVGRAPRGKEISEAIENKVPISEAGGKPAQAPAPSKKIQVPERVKIEVPDTITQAAKALVGTLEAVLLNEKLELIERLPVSQLAEKLSQVTGVDTVVFDGIITQRIVDIAADKNIKRVVASRVSEAVKPALNVDLITFKDAIPQA